MIDTLVKMLPKALSQASLDEVKFKPGAYVLVTLHRPSNVDDPAVLSEILQALAEISRRQPVVFPVHPRTRQRIKDSGIELPNASLHLIEPLGYLGFLAAMKRAALVLTDSGGVQEETTYLGIPCLTARPNTERPITISCGTNRLVASKYRHILDAVENSMSATTRTAVKPALWDGKTSERIVNVLAEN